MFTFLNELEIIPVVARMATAAALGLSGRCDLAVGGGQRLDHGCLLLPPRAATCTCTSTTTPTYCYSSPSTENRNIYTFNP